METNNKNENARDNSKDQAKNKTQDPETAGDGKTNKEPTLRSVTTDSSRVHKHRNDDLPSGGNIR